MASPRRNPAMASVQIKIISVTSGRAQFGPPGYECDLLYLACLVALVLGGSGPVAIDSYQTE